MTANTPIQASFCSVTTRSTTGSFGSSDCGFAVITQRPGSDVCGVPSLGRLEHLRRPVHCGEPPAFEPFADQCRGDAMDAADLEDPVARIDPELIDDLGEPLTHSSFAVDAESRIVFPSGSSTIAKRSSGVTSYGAQCDS